MRDVHPGFLPDAELLTPRPWTAVFVDFFYHMRDRGLDVSITEWLTLVEALGKGLGHQSLMGFYHLCRSVCVKRESDFDAYDQAFAEYFRGAEVPESALEEILDDVMSWLQDPVRPPDVSPEMLAQMKHLDLDTLREMFEERLAEQDERHDGGDHWVGTGGTSPFGQGGSNPSGIRIGGSGGGRSAMQVADARQYRNLRSDRVLDVRQIGVALRQLRRLARDGRPDELDLDETIDQTARNAGDIELVFRPERKNRIKLLLLMDVGGSMTPYTRLCEKLFSAAHQATHFKAFESYYFHNCIYGTLYEDMLRGIGDPTDKVLRDLGREWFCILVGDAAMHPYELKASGGSINYFEHNPVAGIDWLKRVADRFPRTVWLNPEPERYWNIESTRMIRHIFEMFPLTIEGLHEAVDHLRRVRL